MWKGENFSGFRAAADMAILIVERGEESLKDAVRISRTIEVKDDRKRRWRWGRLQ